MSLLVNVSAFELERRRGLACEQCGEAAVIGVVYALVLDGEEAASPCHYRRCTACHWSSEEPFPCA